MQTIREKALEQENKILRKNVDRLIEEKAKVSKELRVLERELNLMQYAVITTENFEVRLKIDRTEGTFEHLTRGEDVGGELVFKSNFNGDDELVDYDGVYVLPQEVLEVLVAEGFEVADHFTDEEFYD